VPLTVGGKLKVVASADLGGLGARDGTPVEYDWVLPGFAPLLLPWLVILGLLALKPNRRAAAWLIWLPLVFASVIISLLPAADPGGRFFVLAGSGMAYGLAAVWLLAVQLRKGHRATTALWVLWAVCAFGAVKVALGQAGDAVTGELMPQLILLGVGALVSVAALFISSWFCRRRFGAFRLLVCLLVSFLACWLVVGAPFFLVSQVNSGWELSWLDFFGPVGAVALGIFALLVPYVLLSAASPFFHQRLRVLLHAQPAPPPLAGPVMPAAVLKT